MITEYAIILMRKQTEAIKPPKHHHVKVNLSDDLFLSRNINILVQKLLKVFILDHLQRQFQI